MNLTTTVKNELANIKNNSKLHDKIELLGIVLTNGFLCKKNGEIQVEIISDKAVVARKALLFAKGCYNIKSVVSVRKSNILKNKSQYCVTIINSKDLERMICEFDLLNIDKSNLKTILDNKVKRKIFLRGIFIGAGNIVDPNIDYHIDITVDNESTAILVSDIIKSFSLNCKIIQHKGKMMIYINNSDDVTDFLNIVGAHNTLMEYENVKIIKSLRNDVNRKVNCETANLNKIVKTAVKQVECIKYIEKTIGINELPVNLSIAARIRLEHPDDSMSDLVEYFDGLGKSGINHRLKKICEIARQLGYIEQ